MRVDALLDEAEGALKNLVVALDRVASQNPDFFHELPDQQYEPLDMAYQEARCIVRRRPGIKKSDRLRR